VVVVVAAAVVGLSENVIKIGPDLLRNRNFNSYD
jgi:hypothetical protein